MLRVVYGVDGLGEPEISKLGDDLTALGVNFEQNIPWLDVLVIHHIPTMHFSFVLGLRTSVAVYKCVYYADEPLPDFPLVHWAVLLPSLHNPLQVSSIAELQVYPGLHFLLVHVMIEHLHNVSMVSNLVQYSDLSMRDPLFDLLG